MPCATCGRRFNPDQVTNEFAEVLYHQGISTVVGYRYAGASVPQSFRRERIGLHHSELNKSDYRVTLAAFTGWQVRLLDNRRPVSQLANLERRTARGGRDSIDHPPGAHDMSRTRRWERCG